MSIEQIDHPVAKRIRESIAGLRRSGERTVIPIDSTQERVTGSIRTLSRSRVSSILRQLRSSSGYSYEALTEQTGLPKQLLFDIEFKEQRLTLEQLRLLAECYGVTVSDILGIDLD